MNIFKAFIFYKKIKDLLIICVLVSKNGQRQCKKNHIIGLQLIFYKILELLLEIWTIQPGPTKMKKNTPAP